MIPKRTGAHKSSALNVRDRRFRFGSRQSSPESAPDVTVAPAAAPRRVAAVPAAASSGAWARRRRIRTILVSAAVVSAAIALYTGSINWWWTHVGVDALLILYYGLSMQFEASRGARVAPPVAPVQEESRPALRKVVGG